ncbi:MAG TPA: hypothetical protein VEX40_03270 [Mycobacterium sp.]|nr:hypothetical protein [Mycobacterium sp.]
MSDMFSISRRSSCRTPCTSGIGAIGESPVLLADGEMPRADKTPETTVATGFVGAAVDWVGA